MYKCIGLFSNIEFIFLLVDLMVFFSGGGGGSPAPAYHYVLLVPFLLMLNTFHAFFFFFFFWCFCRWLWIGKCLLWTYTPWKLKYSHIQNTELIFWEKNSKLLLWSGQYRNLVFYQIEVFYVVVITCFSSCFTDFSLEMN